MATAPAALGEDLGCFLRGLDASQPFLIYSVQIRLLYAEFSTLMETSDNESFLLIVFSLLIVGALVFAGGEEEETPEALSPAIGTVLQPRGALEAWDRYPSGVSSFTRQRVRF